MTMYPITALCQMWQTQVEQTLRVWAWWAQFVPQESAAELSADAEAEARASAPSVQTKTARKRAAAAV
ncbi:MAG: hypothetical protein H6900_04465 [Rhodobacter sp.]|uniref:hypothetical protein n=1 Tax=Pararhodobacter sp. TaxID=2127056 RepID=UPI001D84F87D|nr:hypothetical protein [Pararhodobacter sp.]MCB1344054.1 hypothetical protein [Paracoccaceae bacterium]MCC0072527.1 hypothetical protein [Rhodobacter sp.]HPD93453.1 hypothetical protein [Pararhodobacter sp.]